ncbi:MAG: protoporphyrinogen oxidase [Thermomicrobiales bacterium]|nr:protoporphyrinogen oxidase [Thermomicrobiales bacterium]
MDGDLARPHVVIIGGGISGLAAARRLLRQAPRPRVTLLESDAQLGGKIRTERTDGFVIEGGPDSFLSSKPRGVGLATELGLGETLIGATPQPHRAFILYRDAFHPIPEGLSGLVPTRLGPVARSRLLSPAGKARLALDYVLPRQSAPDEALGAFVRRRLGDEAWERLVEPLMAGIYAADGDQLSLAATFPQLQAAEREHGGVIKGVVSARRGASAGPSPARPPFLTPAEGLGAMVDALAGELRRDGVDIRTGATATAVMQRPLGAGYDVAVAGGPQERADAVVLATPAHVASDLLRGLDDALSRDLGTIPHASTAIVTLAYRTEHVGRPLTGHGYVVPRVMGGPVLACTWTSRKWAGRAPQGWDLLRVFLGRSGDGEALLEFDDETLLAIAQAEVVSRLGATGEPSLRRVQRWPRGMPQYTLGHPERAARIESGFAAHPGLALAGNALRGVGVPDVIRRGEEAAERVLAELRAATLAQAPLPT